MSADELIEKLMAARNRTTARQHDIAFNAGLLTAAHIIRKHFAELEKPADPAPHAGIFRT